MVNVVLAVVLLALSLAVVVYLLRLLFHAVPVSLGDFLERQRFRRYLARVAEGDRQLQRGAVEAALAAFQASFYPHVATSRATVQAIIGHHTGLLSRFIAAADQHHGERVRLLSLAKADRLFEERTRLQKQYVAARERGARQRQRELELALLANTREVRSTLAALTAEITARREAVAYH
jgi:hypothetical protein